MNTNETREKARLHDEAVAKCSRTYNPQMENFIFQQLSHRDGAEQHGPNFPPHYKRNNGGIKKMSERPKNLHVIFDIKTYKKLLKAKGEKSWEKFILENCLK